MSNDIPAATYVFDPLCSSVQTSSITDSLFEGSAFKPLRLTGHPWVRAYGRDGATDQEKPRLSLLTRHIYLHGPESLSQGDRLLMTQICDQRDSLALDLEDSESTASTYSCTTESQLSASAELSSDSSQAEQVAQSRPCSPASPQRPGQLATETLRRRCPPEIRERSASSTLSVAQFGALFAGTTLHNVFGFPDSPGVTPRRKGVKRLSTPQG